MPDSEGLLRDDEILVQGEVWRITASIHGYACEWDGCMGVAVIEASAFPDPETWAWKCLCAEHYNRWRTGDTTDGGHETTGFAQRKCTDD